MNEASANPLRPSVSPAVHTPARLEGQELGGSLSSRGYASPALKALHERIKAEKKTTGPTMDLSQPPPSGLPGLPVPGATHEAQAVQLQCARQIDVLVASLMETENMLRCAPLCTPTTPLAWPSPPPS